MNIEMRTRQEEQALTEAASLHLQWRQQMSAHPRSAELFVPGALWADNDQHQVCGSKKCQRAFSFLVGKHHCRWCGGVFCDACAPKTCVYRDQAYRRCGRCTLPIIFRSFVNPFTHERESTPLQTIIAFLDPKSVTALMGTCSTMLYEFPVADFPYYPSIQSRFPSFYEGAQIGRGTFGIVYKCQDRRSADRRYVAIKRLAKRRSPSYQMWCKILTETSVLRNVDHPNVARVLEVFQTAEDLVIVMGAGQGGTVRQACNYIRRNRLPIQPFVATVLAQVSLGLDYLFREHSIVHRDVKLENIVVTDDYTRVMLIDFGLAEHVSQTEERSYFAAGTPGFASPENIHAVCTPGQTTFVTSGITMHKADIFSLGVAAFMMLCLRRPIRGKRFDQQYEEVRKGIVCAGPDWDTVAPAAAALVGRMLSLDASDRPDCTAISENEFVVAMAPGMAEIAQFRQAARRREDEEEEQHWVLLDAPLLPPDVTGNAEFQQFPRPRKSVMGNLYGSVVRRCWWPQSWAETQ